jgi:integrase
MTTDIVLSGQAGAIAVAGQVANHYAAGNAFTDYTSRKADNTLRAQRGDLETWTEYLCAATKGADCPDAETLQTTPEAWRGVTWGLVKGFVQWMLSEGYAIGTINRHLATVRVYCKLAAQAGVIGATEAAMIRTVQSYGGKDAKRIDERRETTRRPTKRGAGGKSTKKAAHVAISLDQAKALKAQPETPQGRRDALLMALLLDHGLRVGEIVLLKVTDFDLKRGTFTFYRPKVDKTQTHKLTTDAARAVAAWIASGDAPALGALLRGSRKGGKLTGSMSERAVSERVRVLGEAVGLEGLSAHDCRHYWATRAASQGTDPFALRDAGGWSSLAMPSRYVEAAAIANERVKL